MAGHDPGRHRRRSLRYPSYDYREAGAYFVTICVRDRQNLLGQVEDGDVRLSALGEVAHSHWQSLPDSCLGVALDGFIVMPNHVHGIILLGARLEDEASRPGESRLSLGDVISRYKSLTTRASWKVVGAAGEPMTGPLWQRNYYEHVIRHERELEAIREYIIMNPARWGQDPENLPYGRQGGRRL